MANRKNVIKNLEICTSGYCEGCTYYKPGAMNIGCWNRLMVNAAKLLKEQETVTWCKDCKYSNLYCTEDTHGEWLFECCHPSTDDNPVIHKWNWFCADGEKR